MAFLTQRASLIFSFIVFLSDLIGFRRNFLHLFSNELYLLLLNLTGLHSFQICLHIIICCICLSFFWLNSYGVILTDYLFYLTLHVWRFSFFCLGSSALYLQVLICRAVVIIWVRIACILYYAGFILNWSNLSPWKIVQNIRNSLWFFRLCIIIASCLVRLRLVTVGWTNRPRRIVFQNFIIICFIFCAVVLFRSNVWASLSISYISWVP